MNHGLQGGPFPECGGLRQRCHKMPNGSRLMAKSMAKLALGAVNEKRATVQEHTGDNGHTLGRPGGFPANGNGA